MGERTISDDARDFLSRYFSLGAGSSVRSHAPHETLEAQRAAYDECRAAGLVTVEPFNRVGSIEIRATENGHAIAREWLRERLQDSFAPRVGAGIACAASAKGGEK